MISSLLSTGLTTQDLAHLENLDDPKVLRSLPGGSRYLKRNQRNDLVVYLETWADLIEEQWVRSTELGPAVEVEQERQPREVFAELYTV